MLKLADFEVAFWYVVAYLIFFTHQTKFTIEIKCVLHFFLKRNMEENEKPTHTM